MRLYNLSYAHHGLNNIALRRIKISRIEDLNDPFELMGANLRNKNLRAPFKAARQAIHNENGVICFSETWQNPVMWSHYADKHRGICLGFDVSGSLVMPVSYEHELLNIDGASKSPESEFTEEFMAKLLTTKFRDWGYEQEVRIFVDLDHSTSEGGLYFYDYSEDIELREVILGARCNLPIEKTRQLVSGFASKVHVKKARIAFTKFGVVEDRSFREKEA